MGRQKMMEREDSDEAANSRKNQSTKSLVNRIDECETHLAGIETKAIKLEETLVKLMELIQQ